MCSIVLANIYIAHSLEVFNCSLWVLIKTRENRGLIGWMQFNGNFSTNRLCYAREKLKFVRA